LLIAHLVVVALLVIGVTSLVFDLALSRVAGLVALGIGAIILAGLWFVLPRLQAAEIDDDATVTTVARDDEEGVGAPS
jgi:hypothetical protein